MIRCWYRGVEDETTMREQAELVNGPDMRIDLICGAQIGQGPACDRPRAVLVAAGGLLMIFGPPAGSIYRAPGTNAYDHLEHVTSTKPGAAHQLWEGYPIGHDPDDLEPQSLWKLRLRGCLEHNPTPDLSVLATRLRETVLAMHAAGWPDMALTVGQLDAAVARRA